MTASKIERSDGRPNLRSNQGKGYVGLSLDYMAAWRSRSADFVLYEMGELDDEGLRKRIEHKPIKGYREYTEEFHPDEIADLEKAIRENEHTRVALGRIGGIRQLYEDLSLDEKVVPWSHLSYMTCVEEIIRTGDFDGVKHRHLIPVQAS